MEPSQDQHLKTTNNEQMDKVIKEEADDQTGESRQPPDLHTVAEPGVKPETSGCTPPLAQSQAGPAPVPHDSLLKQEEADDQNEESRQPPDLHTVAEPGVKPETSGCTPPLAQSQAGPAPVAHDSLLKEEEEPHETHTFQWWWNNKSTTRTCNKAGTVESLLKRSPQFREIANKNKNKELVIVRDGKAISSHFPCSLIKDERITITYVKADEPKQPLSGSDRCQRNGPSSELVTFHLLTRGGKDVVKIMRNPEIKKDGIDQMTVYAYRGEEVTHALKRDGRLENIVFTKNCALSTPITEVTTEMSDLVDDLDGKTFKIILLDKSSPPALQQSTTAESVNVNTPKQKAGLDGKKAPEIVLREIANSEEMLSYLSSQINDLVKGKKGSKRSRIQNLYRVDYGKSAEACRDVKTMKTLMELSNSVCQVRTNVRAEGSGFLLFDKFVLTNGHVVKNIYDERTPLTETVTVHFSFESLGQEDSGARVEEVAGFELNHDASGHRYDWALLRISADQNLPEGLLKHFGFLPQSGGICIIGHPGEGVKKVDPCFIAPTENFNQVVERHLNPHYSENNDPIQLITSRFFKDVKNDEENRQALNYNTCFYCGSSGSPVFDDHCNVVAMHSGGYAYRNARGEKHSVMEFGYPLSVIIEHIIIQMVERKRFDVLKEYLACSYKHQPQMMANVKKLVESRNLLAFRNAECDPVVTNDESLKKFFEFFSQREDPVPMDS